MPKGIKEYIDYAQRQSIIAYVKGHKKQYIAYEVLYAIKY